MTVLDTLNFVAFNPLQNKNPIAVRRRKLIAKIDEQIQLAANKDYTPTQHKWVTDEHGNQRKVEVAKRVKPWWTASVDGKINLVVRYGSKPFRDNPCLATSYVISWSWIGGDDGRFH